MTYVFKIAITGVLFSVLMTGYCHKHCQHVPPKPEEVIHGVHLGEEPHVVRKRSPTQNLRIKLYYDHSVFTLDPEKFNLINNTVLPQAIHYWERALRVRKTVHPIRLNRKCQQNQVFYLGDDITRPYCKNDCGVPTKCGEVQVPEDHLQACRYCDSQGNSCGERGPAGKGVEGADFILYIAAINTPRCKRGQTVAYAAHCQQETVFDRPVAGHANLCPGSISTKPQELDTLISTVKHELVHALGFSISLFGFYRHPDGSPRSPRAPNGRPIINNGSDPYDWSGRVVRRVVRRDWMVAGGYVEKEVHLVVTPRVVQEVRRHFNCEQLEGAELEDQGIEGTALAHWEKRVFENEAMTGTHTQNAVYSRVTLALLEDTGWYSPDYSLAEPLKWGKRLGCDFVLKSCKEWMDIRKERKQPLYPWCDRVKAEPLHTQCNDNRSSVALCNLVRYDRILPLQYRNFFYLPDIPSEMVRQYGGSVELADYCPFIQEFTWKSGTQYVRGSHCQFTENNPAPYRNFALEKYGPGSRCFEHTNTQWVERKCHESRKWPHWGSGCYQYECRGGRLHILVDNYSFVCMHEGQEIPISLMVREWLHQGGLVCPSCEELCKDTDMVCYNDTRLQLVLPYQDQLVCSGCHTYPLMFVLVLSLTVLWGSG